MFDLIPFNRRKNRSLVDSDDFFENFFNGFSSQTESPFSKFKTDIKERENEYIIQAELPGFNKDNINVELNKDCLTISAENNEVIEEEKDSFIRRERRAGRFERNFYVRDIKQDEIEANYKDGILELKLPKKNPGQSRRRIDVN
ncbi:MAG TPA: Hsp20/alpha crystallin family protein [Halanaerobiales bacterium]|nr:Hsp20/alpha crystallin family protein [Halanaerobiales bacterium]